MESFYQQQLEWSKQSITRRQDDAERAAAVFNELQESAETMFNGQKRYRMFCRLIEKEAMRIAVEVYPELLEANQKQMKVFKHVFTNGIIKMHDNLAEHLDEIK